MAFEAFTVLRLPKVPMPRVMWLVSPVMTFTFSGATPIASAATWEKVDTWPCPWGLAPVATTTVPSGSTRIFAPSKGPLPVISMLQATPTPRSLPSGCRRSRSRSEAYPAFSSVRFNSSG